ncbi:PhzF family phenazine biosynthesis protein [Glycocaulis abyssi]|uniref:PhzF family phenazine biosynthesis protein n=1 Tax=Glycocaulis abyssi TaxID=1433403 RepID=A0ABV9NCE6_9PROT
MTSLPFAELHAFADGDAPHTGNPAAVVLLETPLDDLMLAGIARSNNLSETAYLVPVGGERDLWSLRWFTPGHEVDLCGHATLASAVWLFEERRVQGDTARFDTLSGRLEVSRAGDGLFVMDFPAVAWQPAGPAPGIAEAMGAGAPLEAHDLSRIHGNRYMMLVYESEAVIAGLKPDLRVLEESGINVLATAPGQSADFVSRFFCPAAGISEDPVTGSAHCTLAPYWAGKLDKTRMTARQIGPRPGALEVETREGGRVALYGTARPFIQGQIRL